MQLAPSYCPTGAEAGVFWAQGPLQGRHRDRDGCFRASAGNFLMRSCKLLSPPWKASVSPQSAHLLIEKCLNIDHLYLKSLIYSYLSENNCPVLSGKPVRQTEAQVCAGPCPLPLCVYSGASPGVVSVLLYPLCRHRPFFSSLTLFSAFGLSLPDTGTAVALPFLGFGLVWFGFLPCIYLASPLIPLFSTFLY